MGKKFDNKWLMGNLPKVDEFKVDTTKDEYYIQYSNTKNCVTDLNNDWDSCKRCIAELKRGIEELSTTIDSEDYRKQVKDLFTSFNDAIDAIDENLKILFSAVVKRMLESAESDDWFSETASLYAKYILSAILDGKLTERKPAVKAASAGPDAPQELSLEQAELGTTGGGTGAGAEGGALENAGGDAAPIENPNTGAGSVGMPYSGTSIDENLANRLDNKLGVGFANKVEEVAGKLNCNPNDLLAMMYSESGINPAIKGYNGASGLICFMPDIMKHLGVTGDQLRSMSGVQQLDLVSSLLTETKSYCFKKDAQLSAGDLYSICFLPGAAGSEVVCNTSGRYTWAYNANSALDLDHDGAITKTDLARRLANKYNEMYQYF